MSTGKAELITVCPGLDDGTAHAAALLEASGIEMSYRRGVWPLRREHRVLRGASLVLYPVVYERLTCDEHFELFGHAYGITPAQQRRAACDLYAALGFERYATTRAAQLSGGTLAKLNLALALLADPAVLLLDEPYAGFDFDTYLKFWDLVAQRRTAGRSVLIISHFVTDAERFDRIVTLRDGKTKGAMK